MPPRRHPRSWLAGRLRSAAGAVQRLAGRVEPAGQPQPSDARTAALSTVDAPTAGPRRFGEPPQHWLDLVAAHAPGLLHDVDLDLPPRGSDDAQVRDDRRGETRATAVDAAAPATHGPFGSTSSATGPTSVQGTGSVRGSGSVQGTGSVRGTGAAGGRGFAEQDGTRSANGTGRSGRSSPAGAEPDGTGTGDARSVGTGAGDAGSDGTGAGVGTGAGDAGPDGTGAGVARSVGTGTGDARSVGTGTGDAGSVGGGAAPRPRASSLPDTWAGRVGPGAAAGPQGSVRRDGWGDGTPAPTRTTPHAPLGARWADPSGAAADGRSGGPRPVRDDPAGSGGGQSRSRSGQPGSADDRRGFSGGPAGAAPGRNRTSRPGAAGGGASEIDAADGVAAWTGSAGATVPAGVGGTTIEGRATGEWPWPALPDEPARPRRPGGQPLRRHIDETAAVGGGTWPGGWGRGPTGGGRSTGTGPRAATVESAVTDPWPALPDDATLWTVPADALDTTQLGRLDREQAGG